LLTEFQQAVDQLQASGSNTSVSRNARIGVVRQLCELSRDVRFHLGPARYADSQQLAEVAEAFTKSVGVIRSVCKDYSAEVEPYCGNILERANQCQE